MKCPPLAEFRHLYTVCSSICRAFPSGLLDNRNAFLNALAAMSQWQRDSLWDLLKQIRGAGLAVYYTATDGDCGFRVGRNEVDQAEATMVVAFFQFVDGQHTFTMSSVQAPEFFPGIWDGSLLKLAGLPVFDAAGNLSPQAAALRGLLQKKQTGGKFMASLLDPAKPYDHLNCRRQFKAWLPVSHPVGGLSTRHCARGFRAAWSDDAGAGGNAAQYADCASACQCADEAA